MDSKGFELNSNLEVNYGLCLECNNPSIWYNLYQKYNAKQYQQNFSNWTSGNKFIDKFIQETQLNATVQALKWKFYL